MATKQDAVVYLVTNTVNGKRYIGATHRGLRRRRYEHEWEAVHGPGNCRVFHKALRKYGPGLFDWTVLATFSTLAEAHTEEIRLIAKFIPEYNLTSGGQGTAGRVVSPEARAKHRAFMLGRRHSPESYARGAAKLRGSKRTPEQRERMGASRRGKPFSETHCANISAAAKRKWATPEIRGRMTAWRQQPTRDVDGIF